MKVIRIDQNELLEMLKTGDVELIDVREESEYREVHIKGAKLIPMSFLPMRINEVDWSKKVVLYCRSGARSFMVASQLARSGREVYDLVDGIQGLIVMGREEVLE